jgi:hypothetical protein
MLPGELLHGGNRRDKRKVGTTFLTKSKPFPEGGWILRVEPILWSAALGATLLGIRMRNVTWSTATWQSTCPEQFSNFGENYRLQLLNRLALASTLEASGLESRAVFPGSDTLRPPSPEFDGIVAFSNQLVCRR